MLITGSGRYEGLQTLNIDGIDNEFMALAYADNAKIYVPLIALDQIHRYPSSNPERITLNKLGNDQWSRAKKKALEKIHDTAVELLELYARREAKAGFAFRFDKERYQTFIQSFPFETTPDQQRAIDDTLADLMQAHPMDRLICGDVGFGKTEVAMRAAFLAIQNNKQIAILVPTTLLAQQHYDNFRNRFASFEVNIDVLSRFRSPQAQRDILAQLAAGQIDLLIGTHKLIQPNIVFADLGLVIIDEEHRFGVKQKEILKQYRSQVDILTLTATPIPRTLNLALSNLRIISMITTAPEKDFQLKPLFIKIIQVSFKKPFNANCTVAAKYFCA